MASSEKIYRADYAVVGSGVAGLRAAIELSDAGSVLVLAKSFLSDSATAWAQGGIAVALSDEDEIGLHAGSRAQPFAHSSRSRRLDRPRNQPRAARPRQFHSASSSARPRLHH